MKTEREKQLAGEMYNILDPELYEMYANAHGLCARYNSLLTEDSDDDLEILKNLFIKFGNRAKIKKPFYCDFGKNISIGDNTLINFNCVILDCNMVTIGDNVLIGPAVQIYAVSHPIDPDERCNANPEADQGVCNTYGKPIVIKDRVWIGGNATILQGVTIGENAIIGAGSVVTHDIPANSIAYGNPCVVMGTIDGHK